MKRGIGEPLSSLLLSGEYGLALRLASRTLSMPEALPRKRWPCAALRLPVPVGRTDSVFWPTTAERDDAGHDRWWFRRRRFGVGQAAAGGRWRELQRGRRRLVTGRSQLRELGVGQALACCVGGRMAYRWRDAAHG